jgi:hypothetical protein
VGEGLEDLTRYRFIGESHPGSPLLVCEVSTGFHIDHDLNDPKRTRRVRRRVLLLDRDVLGEVPRLVDVAPAELDVVCEELERRHEDRGEHLRHTRDEQHVIGERGDLLVTLARDRDHVRAARLASLIFGSIFGWSVSNRRYSPEFRDSEVVNQLPKRATA